MIKNRVEYQEGIYKSIERIPFLRNFTYQAEKGNGLGPCDIVFSTDLVNRYMGYEYIGKYSPLSSKSINGLLAEAERRSDI
jgi:hypothetical protein